MTWFRCSHTDHKVAKIRRQFASRRKTPPLMDRQNSSSEEVSRCPTPAARHVIFARGHWKNRWLQSSSASLHNEHTTGVSRSKRLFRVHVMMRRLSNSHPNRRIFSESHCFHTNRLRRTSWGSFGVSYLQRIRYIARAEKLGLRHTHLSLAPSDGRSSASQTVGTASPPAFGRIVFVGEAGSMCPTTMLVMSLRGLALGRTVGEIYRASALPWTN